MYPASPMWELNHQSSTPEDLTPQLMVLILYVYFHALYSELFRICICFCLSCAPKSRNTDDCPLVTAYIFSLNFYLMTDAIERVFMFSFYVYTEAANLSVFQCFGFTLASLENHFAEGNDESSMKGWVLENTDWVQVRERERGGGSAFFLLFILPLLLKRWKSQNRKYDVLPWQ